MAKFQSGITQRVTELDFIKNGALTIDGRLYMFQMEMPGGGKHFMDSKTGASYLYVDPETGESRFPLPQDIEFLLAEGRLRPLFMNRARNFGSRVEPDVDVEAIIAKDEEAQARQRLVQLFDANPVPLSDNKLARFLQDNEEELLAAGYKKLPSPTTARRCINRRGSFGDRPLSAMVKMSGRVPRMRSFDPRVERHMSSEIANFWGDQTLRDTDVVTRIQTFVTEHNKSFPHSPVKCPSDQTIRDRIRKSETGDLYKAKYGDKAFRTKYRTPCDRRLYANEILEAAIIDHTVIDTMLVLSAKNRTPLGRPTLALMVDVASRSILSFYVTFDKPSLHTASQLLKRAVRPKPNLRRRFPDFPDGAGVYGLPSTLIYDRALETIGVSHRDALADIGVEVVYAGAGQPQAKGIIERLFRRLNELLFHRLPGGVPLPASLMREMGYDPTETCIITIEELEDLLEEAINLYHYEFHSSIETSPIEYWLDRNKRIYTLPDPDVLDKMAGVTEMRTLDRAGIRLNYLQYCCEENVPILLDAMAARQRTQRGKRKGSVTSLVKVKYNPEDISRIFVFNQEDNKYYELKCTDPAYARGMSRWQHDEIRKFALARHLKFRTPEQRNQARLELARSIEAACPEIGLKAKRAQNKLRDAFLGERQSEEVLEVEADDLGQAAIPVAPAANSRQDDGTPQHSPQRGKSARRKSSSSKRKPSAEKVKVAPVKAGLVTMTEALRAAAAANWHTN